MPQDPTSSISPSSQIALTEEYPPAEYKGTNALKRAISAKKQKLDEGSQDQYLSFHHITSKEFARIEEHRVDLGRGAAFSYFGDIETLIIKLPTRAHEKAHATLGQRMQAQVFQMGVSWDEFVAINATAIRGRNNSKKEGDSAWQNEKLRLSKADWPNIVIEAGLSGSLARLRSDARWWIENSAGDVLIVLVIWIQPTSKRAKIEKWIPNIQLTRRSPRLGSPTVSPTKVADIKIDQSSASMCHGAPLCLEFDRVFGRPPRNALEHDIIFTQNDLEDWARLLWIAC
ncbi:hypothetical protein DTO164E3_9175 [Paecilomyces variotii]|nr:hypothetical protein DTO164E3_9175 [Paecilomyces variotii]KAJ9219860.1 hypothetical protein DTO169C6_7851 [Paecilomyces variotii]KAJ9359918.1 hypothetical protein DTO027B9_1470 [Paecilomyces variotii]KAJ9403093.1 hypothetical protein DTO045G8_9166 [Paecilomyces variotii]